MKHWNIENRLHQAMDNEEFELYYQPKISALDGSIIGFEALIRLDSEESVPLLPSDFIPIAEYAGLIGWIGEWVLKAACLQLREWIDMGFEDYCTMAINVSNRQFRHSDLTRAIDEALKENLLFPENLVVEITENAVMDNIEISKLILKEIQNLGVCISLDDFGTGYSSLGYLKNLPFSYVKIDRSFIADIETSRQDAILVKSIINMAHSLGMRVTAEGVETETQAKMLYDLKCDEMQGFFFSKPLPQKEATALLKRGAWEQFSFWNNEKAA